MKGVKLLIYLPVLIPVLVFCQGVDSVRIKEIDSLLKLSNELAQDQKFEKAFEINEMAEKIAINDFGKYSVSYANCCLNRGELYFLNNDFNKAENSLIESKILLDSLFGKNHLAYAKCLVKLGILYSDLDKFDQAESLYLEVKEIYKTTIGKEHPKFAGNLNNLGLLYKKFGKYELAEPIFLEANEIIERALGKNHPYYAVSLGSLASLYSKMGKYDQAEALYLETKKIDEETLGKEDPKYAITLINLGVLYKNMGNFEKAEQLFFDAISIDEKTIGKNHPDYATDLICLANLYYDKGNYEKGEPLYLTALQIVQKVFGKQHPQYATVLHNLAGLYAEMGNYEKSEPFYLESKTIRERTLGKEHPDYATSLNNLAFLYFDLQKYEQAEPLYLESKAIREKTLGKDHPDYAWSLFNLANLYFAQGNYLKAETLFEEALERKRKLILLASHHLSEREMHKYLLKYEEELQKIFSYAQRLNQSSRLPEISYDNALFFKGFILNASLTAKKKIQADSIAKSIYYDKVALCRQLAVEYSKPLSEQKSKMALEQKANEIEKKLANRLNNYIVISKQVNSHDIKQKLSANEASIEFIRYRYYNKGQTDSIMYAALILMSGDVKPKIIPLFEEKSLDSLLNSGLERKADFVASLYGPNDRGAIQLRTHKKSLYQLIWKPIEMHLQEINTIYYSPTGLLHRISLDAIPIDISNKIVNKTLVEKYHLIELISTRQLVFSNKLEIVKNDASVFGGIHFDYDSTFNIKLPVIASRSIEELPFSMVDSKLRTNKWDYLPWSELEVNSIQKILMNSGFQTNLKSANEATEETFKRLGANNISSPRVLHIATHGYFFPDRTSSATGRMARDSAVSEGTAKMASIKPQFIESEEPVFKMSDHPMLRSGLIMAGGNAAWQGKSTPTGREDGILTAYEISQMNLSNTELVVLSACETGLGDIQGNEGVYGLQRAFKIAGAKYLIMSLWQVPDKQTSMLMISFYKKWLEHKMTIPDAFHAAQKELRDLGLDPYQWAGFVLVE